MNEIIILKTDEVYLFELQQLASEGYSMNKEGDYIIISKNDNTEIKRV